MTRLAQTAAEATQTKDLNLAQTRIMGETGSPNAGTLEGGLDGKGDGQPHTGAQVASKQLDGQGGTQGGQETGTEGEGDRGNGGGGQGTGSGGSGGGSGNLTESNWKRNTGAGTGEPPSHEANGGDLHTGTAPHHGTGSGGGPNTGKVSLDGRQTQSERGN